MTRKILSWLALAICEVILIAAFVIFGDNMATEIMVLDIVVCSIIIGLFFIDILRPWGDEHTSRIGSMGMRWTFTIIYAVAAIALMLLLNPNNFTLQLLVQGGLVALLILGMSGVLSGQEQIVSVKDQEQVRLNGRDDVIRAWQSLLQKMEFDPATPAEIIEQVRTISQQLRYLSPSNNPQAAQLDNQLVMDAQSIAYMTGDYALNMNQIKQKLHDTAYTLQQRRTMYSN